jgi:adenylate cyclase
LGYWHLCHRRLDESVDAYAKATDLAPDHADLRAFYALALTFAERPDEAVREAETAMRLNPLDPGWYYGVLGHALRYAGRFDDALAVLTEYNRQSPGFGLVDMILTYADRGDGDRARSTAQELLAARPEFSVANWERTQNCADLERLAADRQSLVDAGLS